MSVRSIVVFPHNALSQRAKEISEIDDQVRKLAEDMADTMYGVPGLGLAANQVGELARLIVVDVVYPYAEPHEQRRNPLFLINPQITICEGSSLREEGCLSVPEFALEVERPDRVLVAALNLHGEPVNIEAEGLLARVLQHEIDHLNGSTLLDHASALKRNLYKRRIKKQHKRGK